MVLNVLEIECFKLVTPWVEYWLYDFFDLELRLQVYIPYIVAKWLRNSLNFVMLLLMPHSADHNEILHMSWQ